MGAAKVQGCYLSVSSDSGALINGTGIDRWVGPHGRQKKIDRYIYITSRNSDDLYVYLSSTIIVCKLYFVKARFKESYQVTKPP